jgi:hypothetical protein
VHTAVQNKRFCLRINGITHAADALHGQRSLSFSRVSRPHNFQTQLQTQLGRKFITIIPYGFVICTGATPCQLHQRAQRMIPAVQQNKQ